jgi:hypothetical protein
VLLAAGEENTADKQASRVNIIKFIYTEER